MNILNEANNIVNVRSQEKERMYGPFSEGMERAAMIMKGMTGKDYTAEDVYAAMVALKLSRHSYNYKEDNLLDAVAYLGALNNYCQEKNDSYDYREEDQSDKIRNSRRAARKKGYVDEEGGKIY